MEKINVTTKSSELRIILGKELGGNINLARIKFICHFICSLCKVQTVNFEKLASGFDTSTKLESSIRRIQRFISGYQLDSNVIAKMIYKLIPKTNNEGFVLSIDRSNWKFGKFNINIFMLGIVYDGVAFPLLFTMLPKRGNSNTNERISLVNRYIRLFGKESISCLVADREFVGQNWMKYLDDNNIEYHIRIRNNFEIFIPHKNKKVKAYWLFNTLKPQEYKFYSKIAKIKGVYCYISGCKSYKTKNKQEYLIIVSFSKPEKAQKEYKKRWQIEMCFKAMKSSGFDIEKTHLQEIQRIEKLLLLVMIAFVWCYKAGIYLHTMVKSIKTKSHGRKAKSIFKHGLTFISNCFLNAEARSGFSIFQFLSCT